MAQLKIGTTIGGRNIVQEFDSHKNDKVAHIDYAVASGTNTYTANIQGITGLVEGLSVKIKFQNANTGASTLNINGLGAKEIRKSNGNALSSGNIKAGQILHLVYTGSVFQLLGEGGEYGTATPDKVLTGYTIGTENGIVSGTMKDYSGTTLSVNPSEAITKVDDFKNIDNNYRGTITFKTSNTGKIDENTVFQQNIFGLHPEVIKAGQPIGAWNSTVVGTFTADATATASQILSGQTAYVNGSKVTGTMPNNSGKTQEAMNTYSEEGFVRLRPPKGYYDGVLGSSIDWTDGNFKKGNIKSGVTIFGQTGTFTSDANATASQILSGQTAYVKGNKITGTMPNNGAKIITPSTTNQAIPVGYHNGSGYVKGDVNLKPENIKSGVSIFGVTGIMPDTAVADIGTIEHILCADWLDVHGTTYRTVLKLTIKVAGKIRFKCDVRGAGTDVYGYYRLLKNSVFVDNGSSLGYDRITPQSVDLTVAVGDIIEFQVCSSLSTANGSLGNIRMLIPYQFPVDIISMYSY